MTRGRVSGLTMVGCVAVCVVWITGAAVAQGGAATVTGTVVVNGVSVGLKQGYAYAYGNKLVSVLLADRPVSAADFKENFAGRAGDPVIPPGMVIGAWKSLHLENKLRGIALTFNADKTLMLDEVLIGGNDMFGVGDTQYKVTLERLTDTRVTGKIQTVAPQLEVGSYTYGLEASFDVPVSKLPM